MSTKMITTPNGNQVKESIWHVGNQDFFEAEFNDTDRAQREINHWTKLGYDACCLHEYGLHQLYVSKEKKKR